MCAAPPAWQGQPSPRGAVTMPCHLEGSGHPRVILRLLSMRVLIHCAFSPGRFIPPVATWWSLLPGGHHIEGHSALAPGAQEASATLLCVWMVRGREAPRPGKEFLSNGLRIRGVKCRLEETGNPKAHCPPLTSLAEATGRWQGLSCFPKEGTPRHCTRFPNPQYHSPAGEQQPLPSRLPC